MLVVQTEKTRKRSLRSLKNDEKEDLLQLLSGPICKMGKIKFFDYVDGCCKKEFTVYQLNIEQINQICNELKTKKTPLNARDMSLAQTIAQNDLNITKVAEVLGVSRTAVHKRIKRIKDTQNIDLMSFTQLSSLLTVN